MHCTGEGHHYRNGMASEHFHAVISDDPLCEQKPPSVASILLRKITAGISQSIWEPGLSLCGDCYDRNDNTSSWLPEIVIFPWVSWSICLRLVHTISPYLSVDAAILRWSSVITMFTLSQTPPRLHQRILRDIVFSFSFLEETSLFPCSWIKY